MRRKYENMWTSAICCMENLFVAFYSIELFHAHMCVCVCAYDSMYSCVYTRNMQYIEKDDNPLHRGISLQKMINEQHIHMIQYWIHGIAAYSV